ncbi:MAG: WG repeat-containing protein [Planctomycetia bacterium]|nr:WG repeat-containing protein [Planctomycetia bacterium]
MKFYVYFIGACFCMFSDAICEESVLNRRVFPVARDGKIGFIDQTGNLLLPCEYSMYTQPEMKDPDGEFRFRQARMIANDESLEEMDEVNSQHFFCYLPEFRTSPDRIIPILKDGKIGFLHENGTVLVEPRYTGASFFNRGRAWVNDETGKYLFLDTTGKILMDEIEDAGFHGGVKDRHEICWGQTTRLCPIKKDGKWGCMDWSGKLVIPCRFDEISPICDSTLVCVYAKEAGDSRLVERVADRNGNIYDYTFEYDLDEENFLLRNRQTGGCRIYNEKKGWVTRQEYRDVGMPSEGLLYFRDTETGKYGYMDENENVVIPPQFCIAYDFRNGLALVGMEGEGLVMMTDSAGFPLMGKFGYINKKGEYVWKPSWGPIPEEEVKE